MEAMLAVVTTFVAGLFGLLAKMITDERAATKEARAMHAECMEEHASTREKMGGLQEAARILARQHPEARQQVHQALAAADQRAEEIKSVVKQVGKPQ